MADQFQFEDFKPAVSVECRHCEELVADAVDDLLSAADQVFFDRHISSCADCMAALADARRGAAWLEMMRTPRPEPSAELLERIILATSGRATSGAALSSGAHPLAAAELPEFDLLTAGSVYRPTLPAFAPGVLPFRPRLPQVAPRWKGMSGLNRLLFEPRLAMTAAMAFFSIALTLNLAGAHLKELRARDLTHDLGPAGLRRSYYEATASVTRRYEGLRVVHTVESRLDDLRQDDLRQDDVRQDDLGNDAEDSGSRPGSAVPESRRDLPASPATAPAQPAAEPARPQAAPAEPKQAAPQGSGVSLRARPQAKPLHVPRFLPVAERKLNQVGADYAITFTHKEGGLA